MEIADPEAPIRTVRDFLGHIFTVTIGILIALALEQLVVLHHNNVLVAHARADFVAEMEANRAKLTATIDSDNKILPVLRKLIDFGEALLKHPKTKMPDPDVHDMSRSFPHLEVSAWQTAVATQAITLLRFPEARAIAYTYNRQDIVNDFEMKATDQWMQLVGFNLDQDENMSDPEIREGVRQLGVALAYAQANQHFCKQLLEAYDKAEAEIRAAE
jgi:hypothetical protein